MTDLSKWRCEYIPSTGYYRKRIKINNKCCAFYARTKKELFQKVNAALEKDKWKRYHESNPTLAECAADWLKSKEESKEDGTEEQSITNQEVLDEDIDPEEQKQVLRYTTRRNYKTLYNCFIKSKCTEKYLSKYISDIESTDIMDMLKGFSKNSSRSTVKKIKMMLRQIFVKAYEEHKIDNNPYVDSISRFVGGNKTKEREPLSDEQVARLLNAVEGHLVHTFIAIAYYAGLRREEILGLRWDCVDIESEYPCINVEYTWYTKGNKGRIIHETKSPAGKRSIPIPPQLVKILKESKEKHPSKYVIPNKEGKILSATGWKQMWRYVTVRTATKSRVYYRYDKNGNKIEHKVNPVLGERAKHNNSCVYTIDFDVTPYILRHTCITNWVYAGADIKTIQELAGHADPYTTLKIYAHAKKRDAKGKYKLVNREIFQELEKKGILLYNSTK